MRLISTLFASLLLASASMAQSLPEYLKLRAKHGISQAVGVEALETLLGTRVVEIRGVVKGTFKIAEQPALMVERSTGETLVIDATEVPSWLSGNEVAARLIVEATRKTESGTLYAHLIAAAPEAAIAAYEQEVAKKQAQASAKKSPAKPPKASVKQWNLPASQVTPIYSNFIRTRNKRLSKAEADQIAAHIVGFSIRYGVDARLIMAMVLVESGFNPNATSHSGAMGLGQLMPGTAKGMGVSNAYDTADNLYGTVRLIRGHLEKYQKQTGKDFESLVLALAAYNAGSGAVRKHNGVPPYRETQNYVVKVINLYRKFVGG